jgi:hypothetical protein
MCFVRFGIGFDGTEAGGSATSNPGSSGTEHAARTIGNVSRTNRINLSSIALRDKTEPWSSRHQLKRTTQQTKRRSGERTDRR